MPISRCLIRLGSWGKRWQVSTSGRLFGRGKWGEKRYKIGAWAPIVPIYGYYGKTNFELAENESQSVGLLI